MRTTPILLATLLAGAGVLSPFTALAWQHGAQFDADAMDFADSGAAAVHEQIVVRGPGGPLMDHFGPGLLPHGRIVKNAPYSAEAVTEFQRTLADGNQIATRISSMSYRDSAGRVRQETRDDSGALRSITISDPADGTTYVLRPDTRTAMKIGPRRELARLADKARAHADAARAEAGKHVIIKRFERDAERAVEREARSALRDNTRRSEEIRIMIDKDSAGRAPLPGLERIGPAIASAFGDMKWSAKASVKELGVKEIEGVKAQGKLRTYEIPAGEIGNRNAIVVSSESWYAPELQVTLLTRHSDPRSGERSYRLANIKREEPAAALFSVPSDYTVKDTMAEIRKFEVKKAGGK